MHKIESYTVVCYLRYKCRAKLLIMQQKVKNHAKKMTNRLSDKRIMTLFITYIGRKSVAGIYSYVFRKFENLVAYAVDKQLMIAAHEIGAADTSAKQHIAGYGPSGLRKIQHDTAGGVPRNTKHLHLLAAYVYCVAVT